MMPASPLRVGLIGFGSIAEHGHLPAWRSLENVTVEAIADVAPERRARASELAPQARLFSLPRELIRSAAIDVLDICTPPNSHADLIVEGCRRQIPRIVSEKPLVLTEEEYVRIGEAARVSGTQILSVNNWLQSDLFHHVSAAIQREAIGTVRHVTLRTARPGAARGNSGWKPGWRTDLEHAGGGILLDHGWHQLYLLLGWIRQPLLAVSARVGTADARNFPVEDEATVDLYFPSATGRIELSWHAAGRANDGWIDGTEGSIDVHDDRIVVRGGEGREIFPFRERLTESSYHPDWFRSVFRYTMAGTDHGYADRSFLQAGVLVAAIRAAYRSAACGGERVAPIFDAESSVSAVLTGKADGSSVRGYRERYSA